MYLFDALIYNAARATASIRYRQNGMNLVLVDHEAGFGTQKAVPKHLRDVDLMLPRGWRQALERADENAIRGALEDLLDARRLDALLARRQALLDR